MLKKLYPKLQADSILSLDVQKIAKLGIKGVIFDLDNTLVKWHNDELTVEVIELINRFKAAGLKVCILSNGLEYRVRAIAERLEIAYIARGWKPRKAPFHKAMKLIGTTPETTAMVGDQLFTDILGGNRMKMYTILTLPLSSKECVHTRLVRHVERLVIKGFQKKGIIT